jgi:hypothetical protein
MCCDRWICCARPLALQQCTTLAHQGSDISSLPFCIVVCLRFVIVWPSVSSDSSRFAFLCRGLPSVCLRFAFGFAFLGPGVVSVRLPPAFRTRVWPSVCIRLAVFSRRQIEGKPKANRRNAKGKPRKREASRRPTQGKLRHRQRCRKARWRQTLIYM